MTLVEVLRVFAKRPLRDGWFDMDAQNADVGVPCCCGLPVIKNSQSGIEEIFCQVCGKVVRRVNGQWLYSWNWRAYEHR